MLLLVNYSRSLWSTEEASNMSAVWLSVLVNKYFRTMQTRWISSLGYVRNCLLRVYHLYTEVMPLPLGCPGIRISPHSPASTGTISFSEDSHAKSGQCWEAKGLWHTSPSCPGPFCPQGCCFITRSRMRTRIWNGGFNGWVREGRRILASGIQVLGP